MFLYVKSTKIMTQPVWDAFCGCLSIIPTDSRQHQKSLSVNLAFLEMTRCQHLLIPLSIFDVWGHIRALCPSVGHSGRNAPISSWYYALYVRFWRYFSPGSPLRQLRNVCSRAVSCHETLVSDGFFWRRIPLVALENEPIRCLRRITSSRMSEAAKIDLCGPKSARDHGVV